METRDGLSNILSKHKAIHLLCQGYPSFLDDLLHKYVNKLKYINKHSIR